MPVAFCDNPSLLHRCGYNTFYGMVSRGETDMGAYFPGQLRQNLRRRPGRRDPKLLGWARLGREMVSLAAWPQENDDGTVKLALTVQSWGGGGDTAGSGILENNPRRASEKAPDLMGHLIWKGKKYSLGGWLHKDNQGGGQFLKLTLKPEATDPRFMLGSGS